MKAKSANLRTLLIANAFFKYTDEQHKLNITKLNRILEPHGLECKTRALRNAVNVLKECGATIKDSIEREGKAHWIENRPMDDNALQKLVFAVTTNPRLSETQINEVLSSLRPLVTVFQEKSLVNTTVNLPYNQTDEKLPMKYSIVHEAILSNRRVVYKNEQVKFNRKTNAVEKIISYRCIFTPKHICQKNGKLYMIGYHHALKRCMAVDLKNIAEMEIAKQKNVRNKDDIEYINRRLCEINAEKYLPQERETIIYRGPIVLMFKGKYLNDIYERFGPPCSTVKQDTQALTEYAVSEAVITARDLFWFSEIPDFGIRIKGPKTLLESVKQHYTETSRIITDARKKYLLCSE